MSNNVIDIKSFSNEELLKEVENRMRLNNGVGVLAPTPSVPPPVITPYYIMCRMVANGWAENRKKGETDPRIKKMWEYIGYPELDDDDSYCAATVNACLKLAGYEMSEKVPVARSFETYGRAVNNVFSWKKGDIIVFKHGNSSWQGHVGFLTDFSPDNFLVTGGNQNDKMCTKKYPRSEHARLQVTTLRRITDMNKVGEPDLQTLREWELI